MPYTTTVNGTTITASWANTNVRDQVITPFGSVGARDSAITSPVNGMYAYTTDLGRLWRYNGSKWLLEETLIYKTADSIFTNNTTFANDPDLQFSGDANGIYCFEFNVGYQGFATPLYKQTLVFPAGATCSYSWMALNASSAPTNVFFPLQSSGATVLTAQGTGSALSAGTIFYGANAGTFAWQAAQNVSNGTSSTTYKGSYLKIRQVG